MTASPDIRPQLTPISLTDGKTLPGLHLKQANMFVAFGDRLSPASGEDVQTRWTNGDSYLDAVVQGLNSTAAYEFAKNGVGKRDIQLFSYDEQDPLRVAPCTVQKISDRKDFVVVVYSFGPK